MYRTYRNVFVNVMLCVFFPFPIYHYKRLLRLLRYDYMYTNGTIFHRRRRTEFNSITVTVNQPIHSSTSNPFRGIIFSFIWAFQYFLANRTFSRYRPSFFVRISISHTEFGTQALCYAYRCDICFLSPHSEWCEGGSWMDVSSYKCGMNFNFLIESSVLLWEFIDNISNQVLLERLAGVGKQPL